MMVKNKKEKFLQEAQYLIDQCFKNISIKEMKPLILSATNFQFPKSKSKINNSIT